MQFVLCASDLISGKLDFDQPIREQRWPNASAQAGDPYATHYYALLRKEPWFTNRTRARVTSPCRTKNATGVRAPLLGKTLSFDFHGKNEREEIENCHFCLSGSYRPVTEPPCPKSPRATWLFTDTRVAQASSHLETMWLGLSVRMIMKYSRLAKYEDIASEHQRIVEAILTKDFDKALSYLGENVV